MPHCCNHCRQGRRPCPVPHACGLHDAHPARQAHPHAQADADTPPGWTWLDRAIERAGTPLLYIALGMTLTACALLAGWGQA